MSIFYMQILKFTYSYLHMSIDFRTFALANWKNMLSIKHIETERNGRFEAWFDDVHVGELTYQRTSPERMIIDHTRVFEGFEGQGIARQLVMAAVDFARRNERSVVPVCSYARNVLTRTNEYKDILV